MQAIDQTGQVYIYIILALADLALAYSAVTLSTKQSTKRSTRETAKFNHNPPCKVPFFAVSGVALPNCSRPAKARMIETTCHPMVKTLTILQEKLDAHVTCNFFTQDIGSAVFWPQFLRPPPEIQPQHLHVQLGNIVNAHSFDWNRSWRAHASSAPKGGIDRHLFIQ